MKVKLSALNPSWVGYGGPGISDKDGKPVPERKGIGISFDCPCGCGDHTFVAFANPLDGGPPPDERMTWQRTGDTFDTLTLTPSIRRMNKCQWHGFITNGEAVSV